MTDGDNISVEVDRFNITGYFVRLDIEIRRDSLYRGVGEDGGPTGYLALTPEEADRLADQLRERADRVRSLSA